jgi:hypothetical protein
VLSRGGGAHVLGTSFRRFRNEVSDLLRRASAFIEHRAIDLPLDCQDHSTLCHRETLGEAVENSVFRHTREVLSINLDGPSALAPHECPTRMTGPSCMAMIRRVAFASSDNAAVRKRSVNEDN